MTEETTPQELINIMNFIGEIFLARNITANDEMNILANLYVQSGIHYEFSSEELMDRIELTLNAHKERIAKRNTH